MRTLNFHFILFLAVGKVLAKENLQVPGEIRALACIFGKSNNALENLLPENDYEKKVEVYMSVNSKLIDQKKKINFKISDEIIGYQITENTVKVGLDKTEKDQVNLITKDDPPVNSPFELIDYKFLECKNQKAFFLAYEPDKSVFGFVNWKEVDWFFTDLLQGCDMFVAMKTPADPVLVIHSNCNRLKNVEEDLLNMQTKETHANSIVGAAPGYTVVFRAVIAPRQPSVAGYLAKYEKKAKVFRYADDGQQYLFFGYKKRFFLRPNTGGETVELK